MSTAVNYKLKIGLSFIPFVGSFIVLMMGVYHLKNEKGLGCGLLYGVSCLVPIGFIMYLTSLLLTYLIYPIGVYWIVMTITMVLVYFVLVGFGFLAMLIERLFISKLCHETENKEDNVDKDKLDETHDIISGDSE